MDGNVVYLHGKPGPIGHFLRIGSSGHRQLGALLGLGKMIPDRIVVDAAAVGRQHDPTASIAQAGDALIIDTDVAALPSVKEFSGAVMSDDLNGTIKDAPRSRAPRRTSQGPVGAAARKR